MRKSIVIFICIVIFVSCDPVFSERELYQIYQFAILLEDKEFDYAYKNGHLFELRNTSYEKLGEMVIPEQIIKGENIKKDFYIRRKNEQIFFVFIRALDDEAGIVYTPSWQLDMNGIMKAKRLNSHLYYYQSWQ
jgi:hypothetical protein